MRTLVRKGSLGCFPGRGACLPLKRRAMESPAEHHPTMLDVYAHNLLSMKHFHWVLAALHQKSGQYTDPSVNKTFLASF